MSFIVRDDNGSEQEFDTRSEAKDQKGKLEALGANVELISRNGSEAEDNEESEDTQTTEVVETDTDVDTDTHTDIPDSPDVDDDPVNWMPDHFVDTIQGVPTVNRKGYAVIASQYNVEVKAEPVTLASKTDFEYAEFRAVAVTEDGREYSGFGSAHVDRQDGDDPYLLNELAETRALKRAVSWATGVGMTAIEELRSNL
jgi:hypothetical protein